MMIQSIIALIDEYEGTVGDEPEHLAEKIMALLERENEQQASVSCVEQKIYGIIQDEVHLLRDKLELPEDQDDEILYMSVEIYKQVKPYLQSKQAPVSDGLLDAEKRLRGFAKQILSPKSSRQELEREADAVLGAIRALGIKQSTAGDTSGSAGKGESV